MTEKNFVKEARDALGMTREELAKELGVSRRTVEGWEAGRPVPETINRFLVLLLRVQSRLTPPPKQL